MKLKLNKFFEQSRIFIIFFLFFLIIYFFNFENYTNTISTDYGARYKLYGIKIIKDILDLNISSYFYLFGTEQYAFINNYFIPELITGFLLKITPDEDYFYIVSNIVNMLLLFFAINFFFKTFIYKEKEKIVFIFFVFFFLYSANWMWCFWKMADIYFLFIFSTIFYYLFQGLEKKKLKYILYSFIFLILSLWTKPQGYAVIPFFIISIYLIYLNKNINFYKFSFILFLIYLIFLPLFIFFLKKNNYTNLVVFFFSEGYVSGILFYKYDQFLNQFSLQENNLSQILYFYFLLIKKIIYQLTFIRDTYSLKHNIFLFFYCLTIYFFIFLNLDYFLKKKVIFTKLTFLITLFSILLHSSLITANGPNRLQLFHLIPAYIMVSVSFLRCFKIYKKIIFDK
jgi:hypothetical protein